MRPTSTCTTGLRGFRNAPCCACAMASPHFFGVAGDDRAAEDRERLARPRVGLRRLARHRLRLGRLALGEQRPGQLDVAGGGRGVERDRLARRGFRVGGAAGGAQRLGVGRVGGGAVGVGLDRLLRAGHRGRALLRPGLGPRQHGEGHRRWAGACAASCGVLERVGAGPAAEVEGGQGGERRRAGFRGRARRQLDRLGRAGRRLFDEAGLFLDARERGLRLRPGHLARDLLHGLDRLVGLSLLELGLGPRDRVVDPLVGGGRGNGDDEERQRADQNLHKGSRPHYLHCLQWIIRRGKGWNSPPRAGCYNPFTSPMRCPPRRRRSEAMPTTCQSCQRPASEPLLELQEGERGRPQRVASSSATSASVTPAPSASRCTTSSAATTSSATSARRGSSRRLPGPAATEPCPVSRTAVSRVWTPGDTRCTGSRHCRRPQVTQHQHLDKLSQPLGNRHAGCNV